MFILLLICTLYFQLGPRCQLTGGATTLLDEELNRDHDECLDEAVKSTAAAMMVLLRQTSQPWICSLCRHNRDHRAMDSVTNLHCITCGMSLAATVRFYAVNWIRGLLSKSDFGPDNERERNLCNFGQLAEKLLNPHGEAVGTSMPFSHAKPGERATCACEKGKTPKPATNPGIVSGSSTGDTSGGEDDMDTVEKL